MRSTRFRPQPGGGERGHLGLQVRSDFNTSISFSTVPQGQLVLGRRWWNLVGRGRTKSKRGPLDSGPPFAVEWPFPHLRLVETSKEEWLNVGSARAAFEPVKRAEKLRIGLCCLSGHARTWFVGTEILDAERGVYGFRASQIAEAESRYLEELGEAIAWARREKIHVLFFPELCVCAAGRERLRAEIADDPGELCLVVPGSYHEQVQGGGPWVNASPLWLVTGEEIAEVTSFEKGETFSFHVSGAKKKETIRDAYLKAKAAGCESLQEDIRPGGEIRALVTPVGVIGVAICKDALVASPLMLRYRQVVDHLLVLAMNDSSAAWFWSRAEEAARSFGSATFLANAAQVVKPEDAEVDMALWRVPRLPELDWRVRYRRAVPCPQPRDAEYRRLPAEGRVRFEIEIPPELLDL